MSWTEVLWWLPVLAVGLVALSGLLAVLTEPTRPRRFKWLGFLLAIDALAVAGTVWEQSRAWGVLGSETARLQELGSRLDDLGRMLPAGPGKTPAETFDTVAAAIQSLNAKIKDLESQIDALQHKTRERAIDPAVAAKMSEYLRGFGSHAVVVSCVPDDVEAYNYANQIANILHQAGWNATGPERTAIFGENPSMRVRLFTRSAAATPDTANILIDAFTRFNIPFESGVAATDAIPDPATLELFVSHKP